MRLIDADWLEEYQNLYAFKSRADMSLFINDAPTVEPKKGEWEHPDDAFPSPYRFRCSACGEIAYQVIGNCGRKFKVASQCTYNFCPTCGADMRGEYKCDL